MEMTPVHRAADSERRTRTLAWLGASLFALFCLWLNPVGYVGAGADDEQYLAAARCWVASGGPCLPADHWWSRWPVVAPVAGAIALLGESRLSVGVGASLSYALMLGFAAALAARWFGWRAGVTAMVALAATPVVASFALTPNPNITELAFQLGALTLATAAFQQKSGKLALFGGFLAGLALASRNTSILFLAASAAAWFALPANRRTVLLWAIPGLAIAVLGEMLVYGIATGNPLFRYELALGHTGIPSAELPEGFDTRQSPLFNPAYIAAWKREAGAEIFWPVDGWFNLLVSAKIAPLLWAAIFAAALLRRELPARSKAILKPMGLAVAFVMVMLTWGLAIDPKSRMFMLTAAAAALTLGAIVAATWGTRPAKLAQGLLIAHLALGLYTIAIYPASHPGEARAKQWIARYGQQLEMHDGAASYLTLIPESHAIAPRGSGRPMLIAMSATRCEDLIEEDAVLGPTGSVVDSVGGTNAAQGRLCLLRYADGYWERFSDRLGTGAEGAR